MPTKLWEGLKLHIMRVNALISDKGVCRTAPATPGPLKKQQYHIAKKSRRLAIYSS